MQGLMSFILNVFCICFRRRSMKKSPFGCTEWLGRDDIVNGVFGSGVGFRMTDQTS